MRLYEIKGDSEEEVLSEIRHILFILQSCSTIGIPSAAVSQLKVNAIQRLNLDTPNLLVWSLRSDQIRRVHDAVKSLL